jgi:hypothetical protein
MTDYKKYALGQVENFLYDAMSTDATPQEIYDVIKGVVQDNYYTYKKCASESYELLALLNGNGVGHVGVDLDYPKSKVVVAPIICDKDDTSPKCKKSWNDFWEDSQYTDEELDEMCAVAELEQDLKNAEEFLKKDKVVKWVLPVEYIDDECFISFPEDLLEAANLVEGNHIEWIDQGDGSYILKKVEVKN